MVETRLRALLETPAPCGAPTAGAEGRHLCDCVENRDGDSFLISHRSALEGSDSPPLDRGPGRLQ